MTQGCRSTFDRHFIILIQTTACTITWPVPSPVGLQGWCNPTWPGPRSSSGSLPCHKHWGFITSPLLPSCIFYPSTLFSYSSLQRSVFTGLLQPFSNTFSLNSVLIESIYQYLFSLHFFFHVIAQFKSTLQCRNLCPRWHSISAQLCLSKKLHVKT